VDSGYRGEVGGLVDNMDIHKTANMQAPVIKQRTRIAQGVIKPVVKAHLLKGTSFQIQKEEKAGLNLQE